MEQLLKQPALSYRDLALALEQSGGGGFSQLKALFQQQLGSQGSPPENAELTRLWLATDQFDAGISAKGLQSELQDLLHSRWGLGFSVETTLADWRQRAQRALLLHEFLHDWQGDELTAFVRQSLPVGKAAAENALTDVQGLRRSHALAYIAIATRIEAELELRSLISGERPGVLGSIDTFLAKNSSCCAALMSSSPMARTPRRRNLWPPGITASGWWGSPPIPSRPGAACSGSWPAPPLPSG